MISGFFGNERNEEVDDKPREEYLKTELEEKETDFTARNLSEIVKVRSCTFANDIDEVRKFYICPCSSDDFYPICGACAKDCHEDHKPAQLLEDNFICMCGKNGHKSKESHFSKQNNINKMHLRPLECFYNKFHKWTEHNGYFSINNFKVVCSTCLDFCCSKYPEDSDVKVYENFNEGNIYVCKCEKHLEGNVITMNVDFEKPYFYEHFANFNFNILDKVELTKEKYINMMLKKIDSIHNCSDQQMKEEKSIEFFTNVFVLKILEAFTLFKENRNPYFVVKENLMKDKYNSTLIEMLKMKEPLSKIKNSRDILTFFHSKMYFAEFLFNFFIKRIISNNFIRISTYSFTNLNLFQRFLYAHDAKSYPQNFSQSKKVNMDLIYEFTNVIVKLYKRLLRYDELHSVEGFKQVVFIKFNKIFTNLFKFNLLKDEMRTKYFELVQDTMSFKKVDLLNREKSKYSKNNDGIMYITKNIFYAVVYLNDTIILNELKGKTKLNFDNQDESIFDNKVKFAFSSNRYSNLLCVVFLNVVNGMQKKTTKRDPNYLRRLIKQDFYIKKIFEIMICNNQINFVIKSIENLKYLPANDVRKAFLNNDNYQTEIYKYLNSSTVRIEAVNNISKFSDSLNNICNDYLEYEIPYGEFILKANSIFGDFSKFLKGYLTHFLSMTKDYLQFTQEELGGENNIKRIVYMQESVQYTLFYKVFAKFLYVYGESKKFAQLKGDVIRPEFLENLLNFNLLCIYDNYQNLNLFMTVDPRYLTYTFNEIFEYYLKFISKVENMLFGNIYNEYMTDNYVFYVRVVLFLCNSVTLKTDVTEENVTEVLCEHLSLLGNILDLSCKPLKCIDYFNEELLELIDCIRNKTVDLKQPPYYDFFLNYYDKEVCGNWSDKTKNSLSNFLNSYFSFINQVVISDAYFMEMFDEEEHMIYNIEFMQYAINTDFFIDTFVQEKMLETYINITFNFSFKNSAKDTDNMINLIYTTYNKKGDNKFYSKDRSLSLIHLTDFNLLSLKAEKESKPITENETTFARFVTQNLNENKSVLLKKIMNYFNNFIEECRKDQNDTNRVLKIYKYYNNIILHPLFILINHYLLMENNLTSKEAYKIYDLVFSFLEHTVYLYEGKFYDFIEGHVQIKLLQNIFLFEGLIVKMILTSEEIDEIKRDLVKLSNYVKYFEIDKVIEIFRKTLVTIKEGDFKSVVPKFKDEVKKSKKTNLSKSFNKIKRDTTMIISLTDVFNKQNGNNDDFEDKVEVVLNKYIDSFMNELDKRSAFVQSLYIAEEETNVDKRIDLITYIDQKLNDYLSYLNYEKLDIYECKVNKTKFDLKREVTPHSFYMIHIMNYLFHIDSLGFQSTINKLIPLAKDVYKRFYVYIIRTTIFANLVNECRSMYQLDRFSHNRQSNLSYEMALISTQIIYKMCENQNQLFHELLYEIDIEVPVKINITVENKASKTISANANREILFSDTKKNMLEVDTNLSMSRTEGDQNLVESVRKKQIFMRQSSNLEESSDLFRQSKKSRDSEGLSKKQKLDQEDDKNIKEISTRKFKFINFLFLKMKMILNHIPVKENTLFYKNREFKNYQKILNIYYSFFNFLIQMIQGMKNEFFDYFYKKIPNLLLEESFQDNSEMFLFIKLASDARDLVYNENILDIPLLSVKTSIFVILNNLIAQDLADDSLIVLCMNLFSMDELLNVASRYLRGLYVKHILEIDYADDEFKDYFEECEFNDEVLNELICTFKEDMDFYDDEFFTLSSQIFLFITILSEKYRYSKAMGIRNLANNQIVNYQGKDAGESQKDKVKKLKKNKVADSSNVPGKGIGNHKIQNGPSISAKNISQFVEKVQNSRTKHPMNNLIVTSKFFTEVVKSCEFVIDSPNNGGGDKLKTVFFIVDPRTYLVSQANFDKFFENVDRSRANSKLKGLIDELPTFQTEIEYKLNYLQTGRLKSLFEINYNIIDYVNFVISFIIISTLLFFLTGENFTDSPCFYAIYTLAIIQTIFNMIFLIIFFKSRYMYYVILNKSKHGKKKLSLLENFYLHVIESFLWNDETYILVLNIIIALASCVSRKATFLYTLQLFTVVKFVPTMKEITTAFQLRFAQFISMIGFLAILINFYAVFGFFFMKNEFELTLGDGTTENVCSTLLSCYMLYFNFGIRSGGGIGDLLAPKALSEGSIYWIRYFADTIFYVTVILLILNMINGIVISTFSSIRDENEQKNEDKNGLCFICSIPKVEFEKKKINFEDHVAHEHNYITYAKYLLGLKLKNLRDLDADQTYIINCVKNRKIKFFPIKKSISLDEDFPDDNDDSIVDDDE